MARCLRCNKFMLFRPKSGYCKECEIAAKIEAELREEEEARARQEKSKASVTETNAPRPRELAENTLKSEVKGSHGVQIKEEQRPRRETTSTAVSEKNENKQERIINVNTKAKDIIFNDEINHLTYLSNMHNYIIRENTTYEILRDAIRRQLKSCNYTEEELEAVNYDEFIESYLSQIHPDEDSPISRKNRALISMTLRKHKAAGMEAEEDYDEVNHNEKEQKKDPAKSEDTQPTLSFHTKIVGVSFKNDDGSDRQRIIRNLSRNGKLEEGTELNFVPQPTNPYDSNCILVNTIEGETLGTLSKDMAAKVAPQIRQGYKFKIYVSSITGGDIGYNYGVNIKVEMDR